MLGQRKQGTVSFGLLCAALLLFYLPGAAQPKLHLSTPAPAPAAASAEAPKDPLGRTTPRGTVLGFLLAARKGDNETAAEYLDTRAHGSDSSDLAHELFVVLDRQLPARLTQLSDKPEGSLAFLTRPEEDLVGTITGDNGKVDIIVQRVDQEKGLSLWLFSAKTLAVIPGLYGELNALEVESVIPPFLRDTTIAGVALFEWLALLVGVPVLYLFASLLNRLITALGRRILRRLSKADFSHFEVLPTPVRLLLIALIIRWGLSKVSLPLLAREFWQNATTVILISACVWILIRLSGVGERLIQRRMVRLNRAGATAVLTLGRAAVNSLILIAGTLAIFHYFRVNLTAALAGLGVGGIAIALAAQKTLENVIGGISVIFDQVVHVGDQVRVGEHLGFVEHIGLRSTRIRKFERTLVSIPNGQLSNVSLENVSSRDRYWFHHILSLRYDTSAEAMRAILDGVDRLLVGDSRVEPATVRVRFLGFGESSLHVELFAYVIAPDISRFLTIQQTLLLESMEIVHAAGTRLAYPSQTLYLDRSAALNAADAASAPATQGRLREIR
jgi:MscS family membrane protein